MGRNRGTVGQRSQWSNYKSFIRRQAGIMAHYWEKLRDLATASTSGVLEVASSATGDMVNIASAVTHTIVDTAINQVTAGALLGEMIKDKAVGMAMETLLSQQNQKLFE